MSTSGAQLLPQDAVSLLRELLLPIATVATPNIPEAKLLLGANDQPDPETQEQMIELAKDLHKLGSKYVLVKGGHFSAKVQDNNKPGSQVVDILYDGNQALLIEKSFLDSKNTHGTGCSLACNHISICERIELSSTAAIASNLALGHDVQEAVYRACCFVEAGIKFSVDRGQGPGPINHFHSTYMLPFAPYVRWTE